VLDRGSDAEHLPRAGDRDHGALDGQGTPAGEEEALLGAHRVRHQVLRLGEDPLGLAPVVEPVEAQDVRGEDPLADDVHHPRVRAPAQLVSRRAVHDVAATLELLERLENRHAGMIHRKLLDRYLPC